ncbi:MAG: P-II family nitrogen regulator [Nitrosopumilaceae archaeon]
MKRVEAIVQPGTLDQVVRAIKKCKVGGITVSHAQGQGSADPPLAGQYFSKERIVAVVDDSKVEKILDAITDIACTGNKGDGKVFVTDVVEALDICTKERGKAAL